MITRNFKLKYDLTNSETFKEILKTHSIKILSGLNFIDLTNSIDLLKNFVSFVQTLESIYPKIWDFDYTVDCTKGTDKLEIFITGFIIHFDSVVINNSSGFSHTIRDLFVRIDIEADQNVIKIEKHLSGSRTTFTNKEVISNYIHSHLSEKPETILNSYVRFPVFCLGTSEYLTFLNIYNKTPTQENLAKFLLYIYSFISYESLEGTPYKQISEIYNRAKHCINTVLPKDVVEEVTDNLIKLIKINRLDVLLVAQNGQVVVNINEEQESCIINCILDVLEGDNNEIKENIIENSKDLLYFIGNNGYQYSLLLQENVKDFDVESLDKVYIIFRGNKISCKIVEDNNNNDYRSKKSYINPQIKNRLIEKLSIFYNLKTENII